MIWFTGDSHFYHSRISELANRPFYSLEEMHSAMIERWNKLVSPGETIYHLGDFCLGSKEQAREIFKQLVGDIHVLGNPWHHDCRWISSKEPFYSADGISVVIEPPIVMLKIPNIKIGQHSLRITLCHYPMRGWECSHYGAWHLYGHTHETYAEVKNGALNVGVDAWNFSPVSLGDVVEEMVRAGSQINREEE